MRCGMVVLGRVVAFLVGWGGTVSRSGGLGGRLWLVLWRCRAGPCGLSVILLVCFSTWAVRGRCGVGPGVPWGGVCGTGVSQPGECGRVVLGGVGPALSGPSGAGSAVYWPLAGYCVCGVSGSVGRGILGALWPRCGGVWLGCTVSTVGGGLCARPWAGSVVGYWLVVGAGASLWLGLLRCPLDASRGGPWSGG